MKVLVAGGAGYIGTRLCSSLIDLNHDVAVVDLCWFGNNLPESVQVYKKNIIDLDVDDMKGYDAVVFMAGLSNDPMADFSPSMNFVENAAVPAYLAYISKKAKVRKFVYASSCSVYGFTDDEEMDENSPVCPSYPYGISKLQGEAAVMLLADDDFKTISLRKGTVGGWSPRMRFDLVVNTMTKYALTTGELTVNNPNLWRPLIDIRDVVQSYIKSIEADVSGIFNICSQNMTIGELANEIKDELQRHGHDIKIKTLDKPDVRNYKATNEKAKTILGFDPIYKPSDSVREVLENIDLKSIDFDEKKYYNITTFKEMKNGIK